jgi:hypothetical protein
MSGLRKTGTLCVLLEDARFLIRCGLQIPKGSKILLLICTLMLAAAVLEILCLSQLGSTEQPRQKPVQRPKETAEEETTSLGRPIRIIQING